MLTLLLTFWKNVDDFDEKNKYEREADVSLARDWGEDPEVQSSYLSLMAYYYSSLCRNYNSIVENVPHPNIQKETASYRNGQDHINNFISMKIVKTLDSEDEITMNMLIEKYSKWYESLHPDDKAFKKGLQQTFENSILSSIMTNTRIGKVIKGYRILDSDKPEEGEEYYTDLLGNKNKNKIKVHMQSENAEQLYKRLCEEYDMRKLKQNEDVVKINPHINQIVNKNPKMDQKIDDSHIPIAPREQKKNKQNLNRNVKFNTAGFSVKNKFQSNKSHMEFLDFGDVSEDEEDEYAIKTDSDSDDSNDDSNSD